MISVLRCVVVMLVLCGLLLPVAAVEALNTEKIECHGVYNGDEFWMRLLPADKKFNGLRILELTYTPKKAAELDGAILVDHPQILVDNALAIHAWKEGRGVHQSGLGGILFRNTHYTVVREVNDEEGEALADQFDISTTIPAWDQELAAMLLTLSKATNERIAVIDFFGKQRKRVQALETSQQGYRIGEQAFTVKRDEQGRVEQVLNQHGESVLLIKGWR